MAIRVAQISQSELAAFVTAQASGSVGPSLIAYLNASGGYLGPGVIYVTGDGPAIDGTKTFTNAPIVPYSGAPTTSTQRQYFLDTLSGSLALATLSTTGSSVNLAGNQTVLDSKTFTGEVGVADAVSIGSAVTLRQLSGASGVLAANGGGGGGGANGSGIFVQLTGSQIVSGIKTFTGMVVVGTPTAPGGAINVSGLSGASGALGVFLATTGSNLYNLAVATSGQAVIDYATKTNLATTGTTVYNLLTGASGALVARDSAISGALQAQIAGAGAVVKVTGSSSLASVDFTGLGAVNIYTVGGIVYVSGASGSSTINTFNNTYNITGTGTVNNYSSGSNSAVFNVSGGIVNNYISGSNPIDFGFFLDPVYTGLNLMESFTSHGFNFTGAAFSCRTSGNAPANGGILTGRLYQVDTNNTEQTLYTFTFTTGIVYSGSPLFSTLITGGNRIGLSITNSMSGIEKFSVGVFGGGYV